MTTTPDPGATGTKPWYDGKITDPEIIGHITTKGWDKDPVEAAIQGITAHRAAEKMIGVPANELVRIPKADAPEAEVKAYWQKLGAEADASKYDLSPIKRADGSALDENLATAIRNSAAAHSVPKGQVLGFAQDIVKHLDGIEIEKATVTAGNLAKQKEALVQNWGPNYEANLFVAKQAAAKLGITSEAVAALEKSEGYDKVMEMFRTIGTKIGEDRFVNNPGGGGGTVMSKDQAVARLAELKADKVWTAAYLAGDAAKKREMEALNLLING